MYPGTIGNTHGDKNDDSPARKAIPTVMFVETTGPLPNLKPLSKQRMLPVSLAGSKLDRYNSDN